jgi:hypothetical protein
LYSTWARGLVLGDVDGESPAMATPPLAASAKAGAQTLDARYDVVCALSCLVVNSALSIIACFIAAPLCMSFTIKPINSS